MAGLEAQLIERSVLTHSSSRPALMRPRTLSLHVKHPKDTSSRSENPNGCSDGFLKFGNSEEEKDLRHELATPSLSWDHEEIEF